MSVLCENNRVNRINIAEEQEEPQNLCMLEIRKEKSRDAARSRRGKENYEFYELARLLPLPAAITSQLDKASIIRLTISYLKLRDFSCHGEPQWTPDASEISGKVMPNHRQMDMLDPYENRQGTHILQSLDGFAFILANDGRFLYISETVSIYLGLSQVEMAGSSIFDYVHQEDHTEMADNLGLCLVSGSANASPASGSDGTSSPSLGPRSPSERGYVMVHDSDKGLHRSFSVRMKSTLTKRGMHVKTSGYRVVHFVGSFRSKSSFGMAAGQSGHGTGAHGTGPMIGLVGMAIALPPPTVTELRLELDTFILRLSPDFKVTYCDPIVSDLLGLTPEDVNDRLLYDLCHAADLKHLRQSHTDILSKGQVLTDYFRLMTRHGGFVWVQTCATTLFNNKNPDDQSILAINYVLSDIKDGNCTMDLWQATGDVNASMSSASKCPLREKTLMDLHLNKERKIGGHLTKASSNQSVHPGTSLNEDREDKGEDLEDRDDDELSSHVTKVTGVQDNSQGPVAPDSNPTHLGDLKNKRRKMENPRKRKKSDTHSQETTCTSKAINHTLLETSVVSKESSQVSIETPLLSRQHEIADMNNVCQPRCQSPSPEDLSVKRPRVAKHNEITMSSHQSPTILEENRLGALSFAPPSLTHSSTSPSLISMTGNSVQDLEAAMNRHLPLDRPHEEIPSTCPTDIPGESAMNKSQPVSSSSLTPQTATSWQVSEKNDAMGSHSPLTASTFLRSLYTTRESVIKSGSRSQPQTYLNSETPSSLLTPPEPDPDSQPCKNPNSMYSYSGKPAMGSHTHVSGTESAPFIKETGYDSREHVYKDAQTKEQFPLIHYKDHLSGTYIDHISSSPYKDHFTSPYKDFPQFKDIVPGFSIPNLMSPNSRIHQTYPNLSHSFPMPIPSQHIDACSMTPPASNSPDLIKSHLSQPYDQLTDCPMESGNVYNVSNKQFNHIQLHPSSSPTNGYHQRYAKTHQQYSMGLNGQDLAKTGYYGMAPSPVGSMYMTDYAHNVSGQYETYQRATALQWY